MKPSEILTEETWIKYQMFKDKLDNPCGREDAVKFCVVGAMYKCFPDDTQLMISMGKFRDTIKGRSATWFNDAPSRTLAEVKAKLKEAGL